MFSSSCVFVGRPRNILILQLLILSLRMKASHFIIVIVSWPHSPKYYKLQSIMNRNYNSSWPEKAILALYLCYLKLLVCRLEHFKHPRELGWAIRLIILGNILKITFSICFVIVHLLIALL